MSMPPVDVGPPFNFSARMMVVGDAAEQIHVFLLSRVPAAPVKLSLKPRGELIMGAAPAVLYQQQPAFLQSSPTMAPSERGLLHRQTTNPRGKCF